MNKSEAKNKLNKIITRFSRIPKRPLGKLSEQDITTKFVLPMLESFNWDMYQISKEGPEIHEKAFKQKLDVHKGLPDIILTSKNGTIFVEVKKPPLRESHTTELQKYEQSDLIMLTSFEDLRLYTHYGRQKLKLIMSASFTRYIDEFDKLWSILSNSIAAKHSRAGYKAGVKRTR